MAAMNCPDMQSLESLLHGNGERCWRGRPFMDHLQDCPQCRARSVEVAANIKTAKTLQRLADRNQTTGPGEFPVPREIDRYQVIREIGRGGMGVVYEALDPLDAERVAIKVLCGAHPDGDQLRLFRREANALARLKHPSIATIRDSGCTTNGEHFLVMELVQGESLDAYLREHNPARRERLELFDLICKAINHAHQRCVIHLDIKPSNIMVDAGGRPKILDFGLARIVGTESSSTTTFAADGPFRGTLPYMSPERFLGDFSQVDLRADVYSLGVILYELLTGELPFVVTKNAPHESVRRICEESARRPSEFNQSLHGDLETIILKALEKEPGRRYQSALGIAEDIDRYFRKRPILARPASGVYEFRKIVARHRLPFALTVALFVLTVAFGVWMNTLRVRAHDAEQLARNRQAEVTAAYGLVEAEARKSQLEADKAWRISELLQELIASQDPFRLNQRSAVSRAILDQIAARVEQELDGFPRMQAALYATLGRTYASLGLFSAAEQHLKSALELNSSEFGEENVTVAENLYDLGRMYHSKGDLAAVIPLYEQRLELLSSSFGPDHSRAGGAICDLAVAQYKFGNREMAVALFGRALESLPPEDPRLARALLSLSEALHARGDWDARSILSSEVVRQLQVESNPRTSVIEIVFGHDSWVLRDEGDFAAAEKRSEELLAYLRNEFGENHLRLVDALFTLAIMRLERGDLDAAEHLARQSLSICREALEGPTSLSIRTVTRLGGVLWAKGDYEQAEEFMRAAVEMARELTGEDSLTLSGIYNSLAVVLRDQGRFSEAAAFFDKALELARAHYGDQHRYVANVINNRARMEYLSGNYASAERFIREALGLRKQLLPARHPEIAESMMVLGMILTATGDLESAGCLLRDAVDMRASVYPQADHWLVAEANSAWAACLTQIGERDHAEQLLLRSLSIFENRLNKNHKLNRQTVQRLIELDRIRGESRNAIPDGF